MLNKIKFIQIMLEKYFDKLNNRPVRQRSYRTLTSFKSCK